MKDSHRVILAALLILALLALAIFTRPPQESRYNFPTENPVPDTYLPEFREQ